MSDDEEQFDPKAHKGLLQAISGLGKTQHIRKTTRTEPQVQQDEFQLVKRDTVLSTARPKAHPVGINDIVQILKTTKKHLDTGKQLRNVQTTKKVLEKPLEKPVAERLKRTIGYENVKKKLARWDAVVAKNRSAETQVFPLQSETIYVDTSAHAKPAQVSIKSDLMLAMEATEAKLKVLKRARLGDFEDEKSLEQRELEQLKKKLTRDELIARRKELMHLKMRESQKSAKARLRNKIKSKKYHKLLLRQKRQEQIKEFELLQKTNPEAALEKLNELEKSRVMERASLRHKNTGTWAKNLQVRAKYNKDVRRDLAEQLQVSRQLTQKKVIEDNSDENEENEMNVVATEESATVDPFNPWTRAGGAEKGDKTGEQDQENWRKYWLERNKNEKLLEEYRKDEVSHDNGSPKDDDKQSDKLEKEIEKPSNAKKLKTKKKAKKGESKKISAKPSKKPIIENGWLVEEIEDTTTKNSRDIDDIFDSQEDKIRNRLQKKLKNMVKDLKRLSKPKSKTKKSQSKKDELKNLKDLSFKNAAKRPIIDEELNNEELQNMESEAKSTTTAAVTNGNSATTINTTPTPQADVIDPTKIATVKLKQHHLSSLISFNDAIDDAIDVDESEELLQTEQQMTISQAFEDDDIVADFTRDKTKDSEIKDAEIQLSMPGWGSWAGAGISQKESAANNNKNKRLILKLATEEKRRDQNKNGVYINEEVNKHLRSHLVSDVPFPFTSMQEYEASIRAPIGRNFVPETAFRMLTRPAVITRKGQVIEPMDDSELVKPARTLRHVVDRRIQRAAAATEK